MYSSTWRDVYEVYDTYVFPGLDFRALFCVLFANRYLCKLEFRARIIILTYLCFHTHFTP